MSGAPWFEKNSWIVIVYWQFAPVARHSEAFGRPMKQSNAGSAVVSFSDFISTDLSRIPRTLRPGPACTWRVFMLELDSVMLEFTYGEYLQNQKLKWG